MKLSRRSIARTDAITVVLVLLFAVSHSAAADFGETVRQFSAARHTLATNLSLRLHHPLPAEADAFFRVATTGRWEAVSNQFERVKQQSPYDSANPALQNELWAPIHETMGIWEVWIGWKKSSALLAMFYEPALDSIPDGSIYFGGTDYGRFVITTVNAFAQASAYFLYYAECPCRQHLRSTSAGGLWEQRLAAADRGLCARVSALR